MISGWYGHHGSEGSDRCAKEAMRDERSAYFNAKIHSGRWRSAGCTRFYGADVCSVAGRAENH